jgi:hypothetical protein
VTKTMRETTSMVALGSATEERDAVNSRRFRAALRPSVCWPGSKRSRIFSRTRPPICAGSATSAMRTGAAGERARWPFMAAGSTSNGCRMACRNWSFPALPARGLAVGDEPDAVSTRRFRRSVRLPDGDVASIKGDGISKSAVVRGPVEREAEGLAGNRSVASGPAGNPDLHVQEDLILVAALGIDATGEKHPLGLVEGATENAATVQALLDNLVARGLDPAVMRLFIIDGARALSKAIRRTFGRNTPIQRCQVHKARNIAERLPREAQARCSPASLGDGGGPSS